MTTKILDGFAEYEQASRPHMQMHAVVGFAPGTRLQRVQRLPYGWRIWTATRDFIHGSYTELHDNGRVVTFVTRPDEGDEMIVARPTDEEIRSKQHGS